MSILDILTMMENDKKFEDDDLLCAIFKMDCAFSDPEIFKGLASLNGDFAHRVASGSNLLLDLRQDTEDRIGGV